MIRSITIHDPKRTPVPWAAKVPALLQPITFGPGLNILWGRNGSGKSTVLRLLGKLFHCEQGGETIVTHESLRALFDRQPYGEDPTAPAVAVDHDGQAVRFFDPNEAIGIKYGAFDDDFFEEGLINTIARGSSGQTTLRRFDKILGQILDGVVPEVTWKVPRGKAPPPAGRRSFWDDRAQLAEDMLRGAGEKGPPTVLLDEPDRSLDIANQAAVWRLLRSAAQTTQVIVAAHSLFALQLPEAQYVQLDDSMLKAIKVKELLQTTWCSETVPPPTELLKRKGKAEGK